MKKQENKLSDNEKFLIPKSVEYICLLEDWFATAQKWTHIVQDKRDMAYYGTGGHEHWAIQAQCTAFSAIAIMATAPELNEARVGFNREYLLARAIQMLRYIIYTHKSGLLTCVSGQSWGHSWISSLGLERCSHGIAALRPWLTAEDMVGLQALMISESDYILGNYPVVGAIDNATGKNKPESNIWNGSMLYRTAMLFPDSQNVDKYREKASALMLNGISIPADAVGELLYAGKSLKDWHIGPNFTENYGLNHHGYLNIGYMVICLSNIAMLHFFCKDYGIAAPPELYHHALELWRIVKSHTFDDGRLWRIGGDTRVRYCYCQDYALPMWILASDLWNDNDANKFATNWLKQVSKEQQKNQEGGFLSERLASLARVSPLYYCRLEADRAVSLSLAGYWTRQNEINKSSELSFDLTAMDTWYDDFHGAAMISGKRLASWVWKAAQLPCGTVVPADRSDMAEWQWNLAGFIRGAGCMVKAEIVKSKIDRFEGGFISVGQYYWVATNNPAEGTDIERTALARIVFAVLPDDATVIVLQQAQAAKPVYLVETAGLYLNIPNDLYNDGKRTYHINGNNCVRAGAGGIEKPDAETIECGDRLCIDERINVQAIYGGSLMLRRPGVRHVNLHHNVPLSYSGEGANLYCDLVCLTYSNDFAFYEKDTQIYDIGAAIRIDGQPQVKLISSDNKSCKIIEVIGSDGNRYMLVANMGDSSTMVSLPVESIYAEVLYGITSADTLSGGEVEIESGETILLRLPTV